MTITKGPQLNIRGHTFETGPVRSHVILHTLVPKISGVHLRQRSATFHSKPYERKQGLPMQHRIHRLPTRESVNVTNNASNRNSPWRDPHRTDSDPKRILLTSTGAMQKNAVKRVVPANECRRPSGISTVHAPSYVRASVKRAFRTKRRQRRSSASHKLPSSDVGVESPLRLGPVTNSFG